MATYHIHSLHLPLPRQELEFAPYLTEIRMVAGKALGQSLSIFALLIRQSLIVLVHYRRKKRLSRKINSPASTLEVNAGETKGHTIGG